MDIKLQVSDDDELLITLLLISFTRDVGNMRKSNLGADNFSFTRRLKFFIKFMKL